MKRRRPTIPWKRCLDCRVPGTVIRGNMEQQLKTGGQFLCKKCGGNNLENLPKKMASRGKGKP